jgi:YVTN family beta-propeller protein
MRTLIVAVVLTFTSTALAACARTSGIVLPNGWIVQEPHGMMTMTDTMPQGAAASPDGATLAVVESGFNPPTLRLYGTADLKQTASIPLRGAFGRPVWLDARHVLVAGANADALLVVDIARQSVRAIAMPKDSWPSAVAMKGSTFALATNGNTSVRIGTLDALASAKPVQIGGHIGGLAFSPDGATLFASNRASDVVLAVDARTLAVRRITTGLHPTDILPDGSAIYVAESDADSVGVYDDATGKRLAHIFVGDTSPYERLAGVSPNALARSGDTIFVSLGAANSIGIIRDRRAIGRLDAGWYPTDVVPIGRRLYIIDGKGEGTRANPHFSAQSRGFYQYIASIQYGSIRAIDLVRDPLDAGNPQGAQGWQAANTDPVVRKDGPIRHVFFILKENRSYDQVLGDIPEGNGDPKLTWFGARVTPNEHALAKRFGLFDNAYASGEVSECGHNWADAAFANDYVERVWPVTYGNRGDEDDGLSGVGAAVPRNGYIWQSAQAAHVSFRDYGELANTPNSSGHGTSTLSSLRGIYDPHYAGWNLNVGDVERAREWRSEFDAFVRNGDVPQLEWLWLPNDHTAGSRIGALTPESFVASNDDALGLIVAAISHSPVWRSSALFIIEDDAQDGPDHVSDQRTTLFVVSPYSRGQLRHEHYSTISVLRTIEIMLGIKPLSTYDAMAVPMDAAFKPNPDLRPYDAIAPLIDVTRKNTKLAYGSAVSARLNFSRPDAIPNGVLNDILAHNH